MDRRRFSTGLLASGLAAPAIVGPRSALANQDDGAAAVRVLAALLVLGRPGVERQINRMFFYIGLSIFALSLTRKSTLQTLPSNNPNALIVNGMVQLATIYLVQQSLFMVPQAFSSARRVSVVTPGTVKGQTYTMKKTLNLSKPVSPKGLPSKAQIKSRGRAVGGLYGKPKGRTVVCLLKDSQFRA